jgi:hypothetical protein
VSNKHICQTKLYNSEHPILSVTKGRACRPALIAYYVHRGVDTKTLHLPLELRSDRVPQGMGHKALQVCCNNVKMIESHLGNGQGVAKYAYYDVIRVTLFIH